MLLNGQVISHFGKFYEIENENTAEILQATIKGKKTGLVCGDYVQYEPLPDGQARIMKILPRHTLLHRTDLLRQKLIAANVTQVLIVIASEPSFYEELLSRTLLAATHLNIKAGIIVNKADLAGTTTVLEQIQPYVQLGYAALSLSTITGEGIATLRDFLCDNTSVLIGQSGMGKSSIINLLLPEQAKIRTQEISTALDSGKHTTTHAKLYHLHTLSPTSHLIDLPGLQEFGLLHLTQKDLEHAFIEFHPFLGQCRYHNCVHKHEPQCVLKEAVEQEKISPARFQLYHKILSEIEFAQQNKF